MKMIKIVLLVGYLLALSGCASGPKLAELASIPEYGKTFLRCSVPVDVAVMPAFYLRAPVQQGKNKQGLVIKTIGTDFLPEDAVTLLAEVLSNQVDTNMRITASNRVGYISREQRLLIDKIIVLKSFTFKNVYGSDGSYLDANIAVDLYERDNQTIIKSLDVWGRVQTLEIGDGIKKFPSPQLAERLNQAYKSLLKSPEFMNFICNGDSVERVMS